MKQELIWKKEYEIGDYEIDREHQIFLSLIKKIERSFSDKLSNEYTILLIKELYKYADFHFESEQNRMLFTNYPNYETHKLEHDKLLGELNEKIKFFDLKYIDKEKLIDFLFEWFINHTTKSDLLFGDYLKNTIAE